jgi:hypothetical protein
MGAPEKVGLNMKEGTMPIPGSGTPAYRVSKGVPATICGPSEGNL